MEYQETHFERCDDQPEGEPCICLDIKQEMIDDEANNGETEFLGR